MPTRDPSSLPDSERQRVTEEWLHVAASSTEPSERHAARAQVVLANLGVARSIAAQFRDRGIPREDLEQVAYVGLVAAAHRFQPRDEGDFLSFAVPTIRGEVRRHFRDFGWTVRPPRRVQEIQLRVLAARERLAAAHDSPPSVDDIARDLGESTRHVAEALRLEGCFSPTSLEHPLPSGSGTIADLLEVDEDDYDAAEARAMLGPAVRGLRERDRTVLRLRFFEGLNQREIGARLGVTQTQVSRILGRIMDELRASLEAPHEHGHAA
jgi:RNA polymerase sigma-B factor